MVESHVIYMKALQKHALLYVQPNLLREGQNE